MADDPIRAALEAADQAMVEYFGPPHPSPNIELAAAIITAFLRSIRLASIRDRHGVDAAIWHGIMIQDLDRAAKEASDG